MSGIYEDLEPKRGMTVDVHVKGTWYAAVISAVLPNDTAGCVHVTMFHPISGALPYQNVPFWDEQAKETNRPNCWRFMEEVD